MEVNMTIVFGELLTNILEHVDSGHLLHSARLVSRSWRDEATRILLRRKHLKTSIKLPEKRNRRHKTKMDNKTSNEVIKKHPSLHDLVELLDSPNHFPSRDFRFLNGRLDSPDALVFFSRHGKKVQSLTCDMAENEPTSRDGVLQRKIFKRTPNLEHLEFFDSMGYIHRTADDRLLDLRNLGMGNRSEKVENPEEISSQGHGQNEFPVESLPNLKSMRFNSNNAEQMYFIFLNLRPLAPQLSAIFVSCLDKTFQRTQNYLANLNALAEKPQLMTDKLACSILEWKFFSFRDIAQRNLKLYPWYKAADGIQYFKEFEYNIVTHPKFTFQYV